jgi:phosphohistidine phosphatase
VKYLSILRHGKAERPEESTSDKARPLTSRGQKDASLIASMLARAHPAPDWVISSPTQRTQETAERVAAALELKHAIIWEERIYDASAETLLQILNEIPPEIEHAVLVGHNPGLQELVSGLCAGAPDRLNISMATGALAHLELEIFWWNQIRWGCGALQLLVKPKVLRQ